MNDLENARSGWLRTLPLLAVCLLLASCSTRGDEEGSVRRGDEAFAAGNPEEALAEYRLALRQGEEDDPETLSRVAHTYASMSRVDEAAEFYRLAAAQDSRWADQAVADLVRLARDAHQRNDRFLMASAAQTALDFGPGLAIEELALPLARHYFQNGEYGRALPFYQKALAAVRDSTPDVVMEIARAYEDVGDCERALVLFEQLHVIVRPAIRTEVEWYIGDCSLRVARQQAELGENEEALRHIDRMIEVAQPANLQGRAWFERGEILSSLGRCDASIDAFQRVENHEPPGSRSLVVRARRRMDDIRFGRGLREVRPGGGCG